MVREQGNTTVKVDDGTTTIIVYQRRRMNPSLDDVRYLHILEM
jgi:hypothetical protein